MDFRAIGLAVWIPLLLWGLAAAGATLSGYPGVICITPVGWLLGLAAGWRTLAYSQSRNGTYRLLEAGLAGAIVGFTQGVVFAVILAAASPLGPSNSSAVEAILTALIATMVVGGVGAVVSGGLAVLEATLIQRRTG